MRYFAYVICCFGIGIAACVGGVCNATGKNSLKIGGTVVSSIISLVVGILWFCCLFGSFGWWLSNWIRILTGDMDDGDGFDLYDDF